MKQYLYSFLLVLVLTGCSAPTDTTVYGRYVPERKDDFAWENSYAAFRMYGPALAAENPSNGVDLWLKASPELVVDSFYYREQELGLPYHINYGKGLDCYKVAHTAGCGGLVVLIDSTLYIGGQYSSWQVLEKKPTKFVFRLIYDSLLVAGQTFKESITITAEAGKLLNRADVVITPNITSESESVAPFNQNLWVGGGIYLHDTIDNYLIAANGLVAYAEDALSDRTAAQMNYEYNGSTSQGRTYIAVVTPQATRQQIIDGTLVSTKQYRLGDTLTYYFGACWDRWTDGKQSFRSDEDWFEAVSSISGTLK